MAKREIELGKRCYSDDVRDAIHVAVVPVRAGDDLMPGEHVGLDINKDARTGKGVEHIGVVDPFGRDVIEKGTWFWLMMYPGIVTDLRHNWNHPALEDETSDDGYDECRGCN